MSESKAAYVAELYADRADHPEVLESLPFNADTPGAAKRRVRNWVAQAAAAPDSAWVRLRHCSTTVLEKRVAQLLRPELESISEAVEPRSPPSADSQAHAPKLLQPLLVSLELARSALTTR
jgi:hypothetical protein